MKLVVQGNTQLIESAHLSLLKTKNGSYAQLIINLRDKWPEWRDIGTSPQYLQDFPNQLAAFGIEGKKQDATLMVVSENSLDTTLLSNSVRFSCLEGDQLSIVWLFRHLPTDQRVIALASL